MDNPEIEVAAEDRPLFAPRKPALRWGIPAAIVAILAAAGTAYYFWQQRPEPPVSVQAPAAPPAPAPQASTEPRIEHPNDIVLRVTRTAICGSDLHLLHGLVPDTRIGFTFGHEFTGIVEELGPGVQGVKTGDRVMLPFQIFCGGCYYCQRGLTSCCESTNPATDAGTGLVLSQHEVRPRWQ